MQYILIVIILILIAEKIVGKKEKNKKVDDIEEKNIKDYSLLYYKKEYLLTQQELKFCKLLNM